MDSIRFIFLIFALMSLACATNTPRLSPAFLQRSDCQGVDNSGCTSCSGAVKCQTDGGLPEYMECPTNMACGNCGEHSGCFAFFDPEELLDNTACYCRSDTGFIVDDGEYADPFDASSYIICNGGIPFYGNCSDGYTFNDEIGCISTPNCSTGDALLEIQESCSQYINCTDGTPFVETCPESKPLFDVNVLACVDPLSTPCVGVGEGLVIANPDACYIGHVCSNESVTNTVCCEESYDQSLYGCGTGPCSPIGSLCMQQYWERIKCGDGKCTADNEMYEVHDDCSSFHFVCESDGGGSWIPTLADCPTELPYFDPVSKECTVTLSGC